MTRTRAPRPGRAEARGELSPRLEAAGEALASDPGCRSDDTRQVCAVAGQLLANDGVPLAGALDALRATVRAVVGREPPYAALRALGGGWSDTTLGQLSDLTCHDPLTGLASLPHLRSRVAELYRDEATGGAAVGDHYAWVVLDTPHAPMPGEVLGSALRTARLADTVRTVFPGWLSAGRVGRERVVVLVQREARLDRRLALVATLLAGASPAVRVWSEMLPSDERGASVLLDRLARP